MPSLLTSLLGIPKTVQVSGDSVYQAIEDLCVRWPSLAVHLFDESGSFREHVLCFVNDTNTRDVEASEYFLGDGDVITILQAVSGGC
ncbi:MAG TPA: MoaD/ThiS family protein [Rhodothermia bacterium]